jgi:hypothetical protein
MRLSLLFAVMLTFALVGCNKKKKSEPELENTGGGGGGNTNYVGGAGAVQNVRQAGRRTIAINDFHQFGIAIKQMEVLDGRMPDKEAILAEAKAYPNIRKAIDEGDIILTGSKDPSGLWAYEVDAEKMGGIVLVGGTARRATADEVQQLLANTPEAAKPAPKTKGSLDAAPPAPAAKPTTTAFATTAQVTRQDMEDIRIYIDNASGARGSMPSVQEVYAALAQTGSPAKALIDKKAIYLTGAKTRDSIWAVEAAALQRGGLVCGAGGVETMTAAQIKQRLGIK